MFYAIIVSESVRYYIILYCTILHIIPYDGSDNDLAFQLK